MEFHVWIEGATTPLIFEDETLVKQEVVNQTGVVVVKKYQHALVETEVYGAPGGSPVPPKPSTPIPTKTIQMIHVMRGPTNGT